MFAQIYECKTHGQTWKPVHIEVIDTEHDDVDVYLQCPQCQLTVMPVMHLGRPVFHPLTPAEMHDEMFTSYLDAFSDTPDYEDLAGWSD